VDVNRQGKEGMTPLLWTFGAHNENGFLCLLKHRADPNLLAFDRTSVMKLAATDKNPAFLKMALEHGGNPNWTDPQNGRPIIFETIHPYSREPIKVLIAAGADVNAKDKSMPYLQTPLYSAATLNQYDIVYLLLEAGADYTLTDEDGYNPLIYSIERHLLDPNFKLLPWRAKVVEWLCERGVEVTPAEDDGFVVRGQLIREVYSDPKMQELAAAGARGDVKTIDRLVAEGVNVNSVGANGVTPLYWAYYAFNKEGFKRLLEQGADPNTVVKDGKSILMLAARFTNDPDYYKLVLEYGGDKNVKFGDARALRMGRAEQGDAKAQCELGDLYYHGCFLYPQNYKEAVKWLRLAADQGQMLAQHLLGDCYYHGNGVPKDCGEALKWYRQAAEQGDKDAQYAIGDIYYYGDGIQKDCTEAVKWFRMAADQGYSLAQSVLGECYYRGLGVTQNYEEAVKWLRLAAEQGETTSADVLGLCYRLGQGVPKNYAQAYAWFSVATDRGSKLAKKHRDACLNGMTPEQIEAGEKLYRESRQTLNDKVSGQ
jgi:TPR repeat protein